MIELELPFPPSANTYYRHPTKGKLAGRHLISQEGRSYREEVIYKVSPLKINYAGRLAVTLRCYMPDNRRRDLGNIEKALCDALTHAKLWNDDSQIDVLRIERHEVVKGGKVIVQVCELT